jgi:hypothetical protein
LKPALPRAGQFEPNWAKARGEVGTKAEKTRGVFAANALGFAQTRNLQRSASVNTGSHIVRWASRAPRLLRRNIGSTELCPRNRK